MTDEMHGHVVAMALAYRGDFAAADAFIGDTVLYVDDVAHFDEKGGSLRAEVSGVGFSAALAYTAIDDDSGAVTLAAPLPFDVDDGARVRILDADGRYAVDWEAQLIDDNDSTAEPVKIDVHHTLVRLLSDSIRSGTSESVVATRDETGAWEVTRVLGKTPVLDAPHAQCTQVGGLGIASITPTLLTYDNQTVRGGISTASGVFTASTDGRYAVTANITWDSNGTGYRRIWLQHNGSTTNAEARHDAASSGPTSQSVSHILDLLAGDTLNVEVAQNSGASRTVTGTVTITGLD